MILRKFDDVPFVKERYNEAMRGITCISRNNQIVYYKHDVLKAIKCGIENRYLTEEEFD